MVVIDVYEDVIMNICLNENNFTTIFLKIPEAVLENVMSYKI